MLWIILGFFMLLSWLVSSRLKKKFKKYAQVPTTSGMSGKDVAERMLRDHNIHDVQVTSVGGQLTDHYNPVNKTINLSADVYNGRHVSAAAVAAHECGHAVQHANAYSFLSFRSAMVPVVNFSSKLMNIIFMIGLFGMFTTSFLPVQTVLLILIVTQGAITLFSLVTLPVEIDASARALAWLDGARITRDLEHEYAKDALKWAAGTYVVAALGAVVTLMYYVLSFMGSRD